jgi:mono/diheme cytochrome c family protein
MPIFCAPCAAASAPTAQTIFRVFPYPSFTGISDADALAIKAYLFSLRPIKQANRPHDVWFPFSCRFLQNGWKLLFFTSGPFHPSTDRSDSHNRGAYVATALAHCGECHTPRNPLGAVHDHHRFSGTPDGPDGHQVPNITPDPATGIGGWDKADLAGFLKDGSTPAGVEAKGAMREAIEDGLNYLSDANRNAIAEYVLSQKPMPHAVAAS